jgi:hypothetical protein
MKHYTLIHNFLTLTKIRIERNGNKISEDTIDYLINNESYSWIINNSFDAKDEIQHIFNYGNHEIVKNKITNDYIELNEWLKTLVNTNIFLLEKTPLDGNKIVYLQTIDTFEAKAVVKYSTLVNAIFGFYTPIIEIWDGIKEPLIFDANLWNEKTYKLFLYLCEKYNNSNKNKYIIIYYFINDLTIKPNNKGYKKLIRQSYINYLKEIEVNLKNLTRPEKYKEFEPTLKEIRKEFESKLL